jgi:hypothetical protein
VKNSIPCSECMLSAGKVNERMIHIILLCLKDAIDQLNVPARSKHRTTHFVQHNKSQELSFKLKRFLSTWKNKNNNRWLLFVRQTSLIERMHFESIMCVRDEDREKERNRLGGEKRVNETYCYAVHYCMYINQGVPCSGCFLFRSLLNFMIF